MLRDRKPGTENIFYYCERRQFRDVHSSALSGFFYATGLLKLLFPSYANYCLTHVEILSTTVI